MRIQTKVLSQVPVNYDLDWQGLIRRAAPNYQDSELWKVKKFYVPPQQGIVITDITLFNFGQFISSQKVLEHFEKEKLQTVNPWQLFAIGIHHPKLSQEMGLTYLNLVSLEVCELGDIQGVPCLSVDETGRRAYLAWFGRRWRDFHWFPAVPTSSS